MKDPIRVLVIEDRKSDRFVAQQLLGNYDLDFTWQHVASESELRAIAQDFDPSLVFSANELTLNSRSAALDMLRLLSLQSVVIHVAEVDDLDGSTFKDVAALQWKPVQLSSLPAARDQPESGAIEAASPPASHWRDSLPSLLETSIDLVAMSDSAGWITYANTSTSRLFSEPSEKSVGTVLGLEYDFAAPGPGPHRLALFDASTGLPNPVHLSDMVGCMMARPEGKRTALPIVALDLQGLRVMNELSGPAMSDEVLKVVRSELRSGAAGCGMIARVGEDDLLLVLPGRSLPSDAAVNVQANRRLSSVFEESTETGRQATESVSTPATVAASATVAAPAVELPSINTAPPPRERLPVEAGLDDALKRQAISVHYQPQFALQSGQGCGVEALARWNLASGKHVAPAIFIPVAERSGMIDILGASVLRSACETAAGWRGREAERLTVSVNVSTLQINGKFLAVLAGILGTSGLQPARLELEIEEAAVLANTELTTRCLKQWKQLGVRVAVNHAGNNYSSLSYLSRLPIDRLKLDKSLIQNMTADTKTAGVIHALISLGAALGVDVIAEGVETEPQFKMLLELGCLQAQGYLLARPMPAVQAQVALRKPWGNLPREVRRPIQVVQEKYAC
jgi:EAL domain-containing protein (putative c-di-GMP-specific phosphodiesterase class I)/GGDEF domain-containing protein